VVPTSGTGTDARAVPRVRERAFTLVEILVVVAVAGIVLAVAAVNLFPSDEEVARRETSLLALEIEAARDDAWFGGRPAAISLEGGRLRELRIASDRTWEAVPGRERRLPDFVVITSVAIDGLAVGAADPLVFLPDGMGVPFRIALDVRGLPKAIEGDAAGTVRAIVK
jgi:general secretion pathway protein H